MKDVMLNEERVFRKLQRHLDTQPVGFPPVRSGADLRLLRHHFTADEALVAMEMSYKYNTIETIHNRVKKLNLTIDKLRQMLDALAEKGSIMLKESDGIAYYCLLPLVIGMYEGKVFGLSNDYIQDFNEYANSLQHGLSFISTDIFQMRTIPVEISVSPEHEVKEYDDVTRLIANSEGPIFIIECICRKKHRMMGEPCSQTERQETCMVFGDIARVMLKFHHGRQINKREALDNIRQSQKEGLVLQTYNMLNPEVICACCGCCCETLGIHTLLRNPVNFWSANFRAVIDYDRCVSCGLCAQKCQVDAITINKKKKRAAVRNNRCIGCGNCVPACKSHAIKLEKKKHETVPPRDFEDLLERIMRRKPKWRLGRILARMFFG